MSSEHIGYLVTLKCGDVAYVPNGLSLDHLTQDRPEDVQSIEIKLLPDPPDPRPNPEGEPDAE